jgi:hypothetical protein
MNDSLAVGVFECCADLRGGETVFPPAPSPAVFDTVDDRNIGMVEVSQHLSFALKARDRIGVAIERVRQYFDCYIALQLGVASTIHLGTSFTE